MRDPRVSANQRFAPPAFVGDTAPADADLASVTPTQ
jgi:hypothetical protein